MVNLHVIRRSNVVEGRYVEDDFYRSGFPPTVARLVSVDVARSEAHDLNIAPIQVVEAPPTGYYIAVLHAYGLKRNGGYTATNPLILRLAATPAVTVAEWPVTFFTNSGASSVWATIENPSTPPPNVPIPDGVALQLFSATDPSGNGGDIEVRVTYAVLKE